MDRRRLLRWGLTLTTVPLLAGPLSGCGRLGLMGGGSQGEASRTPLPSDGRTCAAAAPDLRDLGVRIPVKGCSTVARREHPGDPVPTFVSREASHYLLPDTFVPTSRVPADGWHGFFRSADQLPRPTILPWRDPGVVYATSAFSQRGRAMVDHYAFVAFERAPRPGHSVLTVRAAPVSPGTDIERVFRTHVRSLTLL